MATLKQINATNAAHARFYNAIRDALGTATDEHLSKMGHAFGRLLKRSERRGSSYA